MSTESDLRAAVAAGLLTEDQFASITGFLRNRQQAPEPAPDQAPVPKFDLTHVLWYAGALLIIGAMGIFTTEAFNELGGGALAVIALLYAAGLTALGNRLWKKGLRTPGGLLVAAAVAMAPLAVYGVQDALGLWDVAQGDPGIYRDFFSYIHGSWIYMELATMAAAALALRFFPFPFILFVASIAAWFLSMDVAMWFTATSSSYGEFETRRFVSMVFGMAMIVLAWALDIRRAGKGPDFAFWLHLFGALAFWAGLSLSRESTAMQKFLYCLLNIGLVGFGVFMGRRIYLVLGAFGIASYLGYLAFEVFSDVFGSSFALTAIGLGVIWLGLALHRNQDGSAALDAMLPPPLRWLRPVRS